MAKRNNAFLKKQRADMKRKKRANKEEKKEERKLNSRGGSLDDMMAYLDEDGNITSENPAGSPSGITRLQ